MDNVLDKTLSQWLHRAFWPTALQTVFSRRSHSVEETARTTIKADVVSLFSEHALDFILLVSEERYRIWGGICLPRRVTHILQLRAVAAGISVDSEPLVEC